MLHLRCGDDILAKLDAAGVPGRKLSWADPLCEGPWPSPVREFTRPLRARYLADGFGLGYLATLESLTAADDALASARDEDEVVLWFEHDLYDQPILVHLLHELASVAPAGVRLTLVQVHEHPSVPRFIGLGQLDAAALGALFPQRIPVTEPMLALARRAVAGWTASDPRELEPLTAPDAALPHLGAAVRRYMAEYPSLRDGLAQSERHALEAIEGGATTARAVFAATQAAESVPWMGDLMRFARLRAMAEGAAPLVSVEGEWPGLDEGGDDPRVALTEAGRRVLAGEADWLALQPQERWMGGVHLRPGGVDWRWDAGSGRVVQGTSARGRG